MNPEEVMKQIKTNQDAKEFAPEQAIKRHFENEPDTVAKKETSDSYAGSNSQMYGRHKRFTNQA